MCQLSIEHHRPQISDPHVGEHGIRAVARVFVWVAKAEPSPVASDAEKPDGREVDATAAAGQLRKDPYEKQAF